MNEHSYRIVVGINNVRNIIKDYEFIDLYVNLPEKIDTNELKVKINNELATSWSLSDDILIIRCLNIFSEQNSNNLNVIILK